MAALRDQQDLVIQRNGVGFSSVRNDVAVNVDSDDGGNCSDDDENNEVFDDGRRQDTPLRDLTLPVLKRRLHLIIDVQTRWNSTFFMLERFLILKPCLIAVMAQNEKHFGGELQLHADEWRRMENIWQILYYAAELTVRAQAEKFPSRGRALWDLKMLMTIYSQVSDDDLQSRQAREVCVLTSQLMLLSFI
jgi:hypothetical protein